MHMSYKTYTEQLFEQHRVDRTEARIQTTAKYARAEVKFRI